MVQGDGGCVAGGVAGVVVAGTRCRQSCVICPHVDERAVADDRPSIK